MAFFLPDYDLKRCPKSVQMGVKKGVFQCIWENKKCENRLKSQSSHLKKAKRRGRDSNAIITHMMQNII
jgi:hypothetical protein